MSRIFEQQQMGLTKVYRFLHFKSTINREWRQLGSGGGCEAVERIQSVDRLSVERQVVREGEEGAAPSIETFDSLQRRRRKSCFSARCAR